MVCPPIPDNEAARVAALHEYAILDTPQDPAYDAFANLAAQVCDMPIALVNLVDTSRTWVKADFGLARHEFPRDVAFCSHAIASDDIFEIPDALLDPRFVKNPLVTGEPHVRYYAGAPLVDRYGHVLGALCTFDYVPRSLTEKQRETMRHLASSLVALIESRHGISEESLAKVALSSQALEHIAEPITIERIPTLDAMPTFVYVNRAFEDVFGYGKVEIIGTDPSILCGPETDLAQMSAFREAVIADLPAQATTLLYAADGTTRLCELRNRRIDEFHRITSVRDVTREHAMRQAISATNERLQSLLDNNTETVLTLDRRGACVAANNAVHDLLGYDIDDLRGSRYRKLLEDPALPEEGRFREALRTGKTMAFRTICRHRDGREIEIECRTVPIVVDGRSEGAYIIGNDITEASRLARLVEARAKRVRALYLISASKATSSREQIDAALELALETLDMQYGYVGAIEGDAIRIEHGAGPSPAAAVGAVVPLRATYVRETLDLGDVLAMSDLAAEHARSPDAPVYPDWHGYISAPILVDGRAHGAIGFLSRRIEDFDEFDRDFVRLVAALVAAALERDMQKRRLAKLAYYDALTGLANRAQFCGDLEAAIGRGRRHLRSFAIHYVDLDGFKGVNDRYGHAVGDAILCDVATRLRELCRNYDVPARLGGDEFVVLQDEVERATDCSALGRRIVESLSRPYRVDDRTIELSASVGVSIFPDDGSDASTLLHRADLAQYRAKGDGKNRCEMSGVS